MDVTFVAEPGDPRLEPYRRLLDRKSQPTGGWLIAESRFLVERLLDTEWEMHSILVDDPGKVPELPSHRTGKFPIYHVGRAAIAEIVGFKFHRGILAAGRRPERTEVTADLLTESSWTILAVANVVDAENLGALIRTSCGFGAAAVVLDSRSADPYSRRALRVSTGHAFKIPIVESADFLADLQALQETGGGTLYATVLADDAQPLHKVKPADRSVIVVGNEGFGLDSPLVELCRQKITIPMHRGSDSLNVAMAAGIFLYHFCGQRPAGSSGR